jgi:proline dehydrogenase
LICSEAHKNNVSLLIDGEESWMQDAADELVTDMMRIIKKSQLVHIAIVSLGSFGLFEKLHEVAKREGFIME